MNKQVKQFTEEVYYPEVIPDKTEELVENFRREKIFLKEQGNADKRNRDLVEALNGLTNHQRDLILGSLRTLIIFIKGGKVIYTGNNQYRTYEADLDPKDNPYKLLLFLAGHPALEFHPNELAMSLNPVRAGAVHASNERRVRDTIKKIKSSMKLNLKEDDFFIINKGSFGINCNVELKVW